MEKNKDQKYIEAIGRRKTATARVRLTPSTKKNIVVNEKTVVEYFKTSKLISVVESPFGVFDVGTYFEVSVLVEGGGSSSQADAVRHGIARALTKYNPESRTPLKKIGFLKRDSRSKERKKPGLRRARKSPQWSKR